MRRLISSRERPLVSAPHVWKQSVYQWPVWYTSKCYQSWLNVEGGQGGTGSGYHTREYRESMHIYFRGRELSHAKRLNHW